jgi:hypothetical protein
VRLEIAMEHTDGVRGRDTLGDCTEDAQGALDGQTPGAAQQGREALAVDDLHRQKAHVLVLTEVVDTQDVGVRDRARERDFAPKVIERLGVARTLRPDDLEGDLPPELAIVRAVDLAHAPPPDALADLVALAEPRELPSAACRVALGDRLADGRSHVRRGRARRVRGHAREHEPARAAFAHVLVDERRFLAVQGAAQEVAELLLFGALHAECLEGVYPGAAADLSTSPYRLRRIDLDLDLDLDHRPTLK